MLSLRALKDEIVALPMKHALNTEYMSTYNKFLNKIQEVKMSEEFVQMKVTSPSSSLFDSPSSSRKIYDEDYQLGEEHPAPPCEESLQDESDEYELQKPFIFITIIS